MTSIHPPQFLAFEADFDSPQWSPRTTSCRSGRPCSVFFSSSKLRDRISGEIRLTIPMAYV